MKKVGRRRVARFCVQFEATNEFVRLARDADEILRQKVGAIPPPRQSRWLNGAEAMSRERFVSEPPDAWMRGVIVFLAKGRVWQTFIGRSDRRKR